MTVKVAGNKPKRIRVIMEIGNTIWNTGEMLATDKVSQCPLSTAPGVDTDSREPTPLLLLLGERCVRAQ